MGNVKNFGVIVCLAVAFGLPKVLAYPAENEEENPKGSNLKYTFGSKDEVPSVFFEDNPEHAPAKRSDEERKSYPPCQDGSGGMCVDSGSCPSNLKPETTDATACAKGLECCYGPPASDKSCRSRGGECVSRGQCGNAPTFKEAQDCDAKNGQVCCIFV